MLFRSNKERETSIHNIEYGQRDDHRAASRLRSITVEMATTDHRAESRWQPPTIERHRDEHQFCFLPFSVNLTQEGSRNHTIKDCIGVQFLYLRYRMTGPVGGEPYRFFTYRSELDIPERDFLKNISPTLWVIRQAI